MLPLTILFSDDFRLLSSQQLFKGLSHYRVSDDRVLTDTWKALKVKTSIPLPANEGLASIDLPLDLPLTMEAANRRFSRYLTLCEKPIPTCIIVNPAQLHPRYEPLKRSHIRDGVCQRLYALALTAREHKHELILQPPNEDTLELTLDILAETLNKPGLMHWGGLGLGLHTSSKCALPILGWLEHLGRELVTDIPLQLTTWALSTTSLPNAQQPVHQVFIHREQARITQDLCQYFIMSTNNSRLQAHWIIHPAQAGSCPSQADEPGLPIHSNATWNPTDRLLNENTLRTVLQRCSLQSLDAFPLINGESLVETMALERLAATDARIVTGALHAASETQIRAAFKYAASSQPDWNRTPVGSRADILQRWADRLQQEQEQLVATCIRESGLSIRDALADLHTGINLCYHYCTQARSKLPPHNLLAGPNEQRRVEFHGRGIFVCLTDHNEPLATLISQLAALLVTGNAVLLNPDSSSASCASKLIEHLLEAGLPSSLLALMPGTVDTLAPYLLADSRLAGCVSFLDPCRTSGINTLLANRKGTPVSPLLTHSCAPGTHIINRPLKTHEIRALLHSAFSHAGQKRSTLGTLFIDSSVADRIEQDLANAMQLMLMDDPLQLESDIGPLSQRNLMEQCYQHIERFRLLKRVLAQLPLNSRHDHGFYVPPTLLRLYTLDELPVAISGPVLHLIRFEHNDLSRVLDEINRHNPDQACGLYTDNDAIIEQVETTLLASRLLINRPSSAPDESPLPAGSSGVADTLPFYGGPNYLMSFVRERAISRRY